MTKIAIRLALLVGIIASLLTIQGASAQPDEPRLFPQTGYTIKGNFKRYWEEMGGLSVFGYPISSEAWEVNAADGKQYVTQWFERHRMEDHPELANDPNYYILLGLIGNELYRPSSPVTPNTYLREPCRLVEGVPVCGRFRTYWDAFGLKFGPTEGLMDNSSLVAGPFHVAFGEMVFSEIWRRIFLALHFDNAKKNLLTLTVAPGMINAAIGHKAMNKAMLLQSFRKVTVTESAGLKGFEYHAHTG